MTSGMAFVERVVGLAEVGLDLMEVCVCHGQCWHAGALSRWPAPLFGPLLRTSSTADMASRSSRIHSASCWATRRTHQASASLRLRATPASINVSSAWRSSMRSRVMTGTPAVVNRTREPPHSAPHDTARRNAGWASSAMRMRAWRLSSRNPLMRACSATRTSSSPAPSGSCGGASVPTTWISSPSMAMVGLGRVPGGGHPPGEPGPDQPLLLGPRGRWAGDTPPPPLGSPSGLAVRHITRLHDYLRWSKRRGAVRSGAS